MNDVNAELRAQLNQAHKDGHYVFIPSPIPSKESLFKPTLEIKRLKVEDFYLDKGKHIFHHTGYKKLANAAGISWVSEFGRTGRMDNLSKRNYCSYVSIAKLRKADGLVYEYPGSKHLDLEVVEIQAKAKYDKQYDFKLEGHQKKGWKEPWPASKDDFIKYYVERDVSQKANFIEELCQTGSKSRAIKSALELPNSFDQIKDQRGQDTGNHLGLSKDFYMVSYVFDATDPDARQVVLDSLAASYGAIYPKARIPRLPNQPREINPPAETQVPADPEPGKKNIPENELLDFENCERDQQLYQIKDCVLRSGYQGYQKDTKNNPLEQWGSEDLVKYYIHLRNKEINK